MHKRFCSSAQFKFLQFSKIVRKISDLLSPRATNVMTSLGEMYPRSAHITTLHTGGMPTAFR